MNPSTLSPLPPSLCTILKGFEAFEKGMVFLDKRGIPLKLPTVIPVVRHLLNGQFTEQDLCRLWHLGKGIFDIRWQTVAETWGSNRSVDNDAVLMVVPNPDQNWVGKRNMSERVAVVHERLLRYVSPDGEASLPPTRPLPTNNRADDNAATAPQCPVPAALTGPISINDIIPHLKSLPFYKDQIKHIQTFTPRAAEATITRACFHKFACHVYEIHQRFEDFGTYANAPGMSIVQHKSQRASSCLQRTRALGVQVAALNGSN